MNTRAEVEKLSAREDRIAHQLSGALYLSLMGLCGAMALQVFPPEAVQISAWVVGAVGLAFFIVHCVRSGRATTARARAQSAVEDAEAMERINGRSS